MALLPYAKRVATQRTPGRRATDVRAATTPPCDAEAPPGRRRRA